MTDPDVELLERWRGGDEAAGNRLVRLHFSAVYRFFGNKIPEGVADLTQLTFLALVESRDRIEAHTGFRAYLLGVARHKLIHHLRGRYRTDAVFSPEHVSVLDIEADPGPSPTHRLAEDQERQLLDTALRSLPLDHQITLELYYWDEMSVAEIATVLERSPGAIKSRLFRARQLLAAQVERLARDPEPLLSRLEDELGSMRRPTVPPVPD
ncbi:MAG: RNA polymerase sigma factor [Deltaproteobacteria bacterium]|nr:RNA polymerase sigma factor [Deltaproteobacteria bacterium]